MSLLADSALLARSMRRSIICPVGHEIDDVTVELLRMFPIVEMPTIIRKQQPSARVGFRDDVVEGDIC